MSTRSTIKIEGVGFAKIYKHLGGEPEYMLKWLEEFNQDFTKNRGVNDNEYKFAQCLRYAALNAGKYSLDGSLYTGWGVVKFNEGMDEDYEYILKTSGEVSYFRRNEKIAEITQSQFDSTGKNKMFDLAIIKNGEIIESVSCIDFDEAKQTAKNLNAKII